MITNTLLKSQLVYNITKLIDSLINYFGALTGSLTAMLAWMGDLDHITVLVGLGATILSCYFQFQKHVLSKKRAKREETLFNLQLEAMKNEKMNKKLDN